MRVLISEEQIRQRVDLVASEIRQTYGHEPVTIIGVLTGCLVFLADLIRRLDLPIRIILVQASSYRGATTTGSQLAVNDDVLGDLKGRHILIVEDILDTGKTLRHMVNLIQAREVASVRIAVLMRKLGRQIIEIEPDFVCFRIPDEFVVGYGLDYNDEFRNLPYIAIYEGQK